MYLRQDGHLTANTLKGPLMRDLQLLMYEPYDWKRFEIVCTEKEYQALPKLVRDLNEIKALKIRFVIKDESH